MHRNVRRNFFVGIKRIVIAKSYAVFSINTIRLFPRNFRQKTVKDT